MIKFCYIDYTSTRLTLSLEVIQHCNGYEDAMDAFITDSSSVNSMEKLLFYRVNWRCKLILMESIIDDWVVLRYTQSRDIMLKYSHKSRLGFSISYLVCASVVSFASNFVLEYINLS